VARVTRIEEQQYGVAMLPVRGRSYHDAGLLGRGENRESSMRDWRAAISTPLTYRIGSSTLHFRSHLVSLSTVIAGAVLLLLYLSVTRGTRTVARPSSVGCPNSSYPASPGVRGRDWVEWRLAVVADPDQGSKTDNGWSSFLRHGRLRLTGGPGRRHANLSWEAGEVEVAGRLGAGGRGMELSELQWFAGRLLAPDDRTGVLYSLAGNTASPWVILADGAGSGSKGFKAEWSAVIRDRLVVGGLGKEWTTSQGEILSHDPMWVKEVSGG